MKYTLLLFLFCLSLIYSCRRQSNTYLYHNTAIDITDELDTTILLYPATLSPCTFMLQQTGKALHFYQYIGLIESGEYGMILDGKKRCLVKSIFRGTIDKQTLSRRLYQNLVYLEPKWKGNISLDKKLLGLLPDDLDTTVILYDQDNVPLKFSQYLPILFNEKGTLHMSKEGKFLWIYPEKMKSRIMPLVTSLDTGRVLQACYESLLNADKVLVNKAERKVYLQRGHKTFLTFSCQLGRNPLGDKQQEGDGRTPEGSYTLVGQTGSAKYGKAFLISYPDSVHLAAAKKRGVSAGKEIMVHTGNAAKSDLKDWTNGCIAISNADMEKFFTYVQPGTPIEIRK